MNWTRLKRELRPKRVFNLTKLGWLNYIAWPLGAISYFVVIYQLGLKYIFPSVSLLQGVGLFFLGILAAYLTGLTMKLRHKAGGLFQDEQEMITEANPFARLNYEITLRQLDLTIEATEASIKWLHMEGIDTEQIEVKLVPIRDYRKTVWELLQKWG